MAAQYSETSQGTVNAADYQTLGDFSKNGDGLPVALQFRSRADEKNFLDPERKTNMRVGGIAPVDHNTLVKGGRFRSTETFHSGGVTAQKKNMPAKRGERFADPDSYDR